MSWYYEQTGVDNYYGPWFDIFDNEKEDGPEGREGIARTWSKEEAKQIVAEHNTCEAWPRTAEGEMVKDGKEYFMGCANGAISIYAYLSALPGEAAPPWTWNKVHLTREAAEPQNPST